MYAGAPIVVRYISVSPQLRTQTLSHLGLHHVALQIPVLELAHRECVWLDHHPWIDAASACANVNQDRRAILLLANQRRASERRRTFRSKVPALLRHPRPQPPAPSACCCLRCCSMLPGPTCRKQLDLEHKLLHGALYSRHLPPTHRSAQRILGGGRGRGGLASEPVAAGVLDT